MCASTSCKASLASPARLKACPEHAHNSWHQPPSRLHSLKEHLCCNVAICSFCVSGESVSVMYCFESKPTGEFPCNGMDCTMFDFPPCLLPPAPCLPPAAPPIAMQVAACICRLANSSSSIYSICSEFEYLFVETSNVCSQTSRGLSSVSTKSYAGGRQCTVTSG